MTWKKLLSPTLRIQPIPYQLYKWVESETQMLEIPCEFNQRPLADVMNTRRSKRTFHSIDITNLSKILWLTSRIQETAKSKLGFELSRRPSLSSGAIHPIHILVQLNRGEAWWRYDAHKHSLTRVAEGFKDEHGLNSAVKDVLDPDQGAVMLFVAELGKTSAKYINAESLIWRDAGVLLAMLALASDTENMNFCPLGITGDPWASSLDNKGRLIGVGMAILGSSTTL
jgi:hypothetical protein